MPALRPAGVCLLFVAAALLRAQSPANADLAAATVTSPNGQITLRLYSAGAASNDLRYTVDFHGKPLFVASKLGLDLRRAAGAGSRHAQDRRSSRDRRRDLHASRGQDPHRARPLQRRARRFRGRHRAQAHHRSARLRRRRGLSLSGSRAAGVEADPHCQRVD